MPKTEMLINCIAGEECRIAIVADGELEELYQERASTESHVGNIYKGQVLNVEPSIQAAFIDFGLERNGFLHISDLHPRYFPGKEKSDAERVGKKTPHRERPPIQKCLHRGQEVLVQILKEGIGTKGPTVTSYLSIPGRYLVMMPHMERMGVSRKIDDDEARREMRRILDELKPPKDFGFIIRTAGIERTKAELKRDLVYLQRLWNIIEQRRSSNIRIGELHAESDLVIRTIRDVFSSDIDRILVDNEQAARRAQEYLTIASPRTTSKVFLYKDPIPLFHRFDIERQIEQINSRVVDLPSGGSLVIDSTEALVAIDVNSGKMRDNQDAETTAYKTDMEAANEVCRQLRLRDLGGVVIIDLIDLREARHRRSIEQRFRQNLKKDRARTKILSISQFGILEMTRQRMRPSLTKSLSIDCHQCHATGRLKSCESVVLDVLRHLATVMHHEKVAHVEVTISPDVAFQLLNRKRAELVQLEHHHQTPAIVRVHNAGPIDYMELVAFDARGGNVNLSSNVPTEQPKLIPIEEIIKKSSASQAKAQTTTIDPQAQNSPPDRVASETTDVTSRQRRRRRGGHHKKTTKSQADHTQSLTAPPLPTEHNPSAESKVSQHESATVQTQPDQTANANTGQQSQRTRVSKKIKTSGSHTAPNPKPDRPVPRYPTPAPKPSRPTIHKDSASRGYSNTVVPSQTSPSTRNPS